MRSTRRSRIGALVAAGLLSMAAVACANGGSTLGVQQIINPSPGTPVSFQNDVQPIFNTNCTYAGCHSGSFPAQFLNLQQGSSYNNLVGPSGTGLTSTEVPTILLVDPRNSSLSYLIMKLEGTQSSGVRMPYGLPALPQPTIQVVRDWIDQGARNN